MKKRSANGSKKIQDFFSKSSSTVQLPSCISPGIEAVAVAGTPSVGQHSGKDSAGAVPGAGAGTSSPSIGRLSGKDPSGAGRGAGAGTSSPSIGRLSGKDPSGAGRGAGAGTSSPSIGRLSGKDPSGAGRGAGAGTSSPSIDHFSECFTHQSSFSFSECSESENAECAGQPDLHTSGEDGLSKDLSGNTSDGKESPKAKKTKKTGQKRKRATQYYCASWKSELKWIAESQRGRRYAYCTTCRKSISCTGGITDMKKHANRDNHKTAAKHLPDRHKMNEFIGKDEKAKITEAKICAWAAEKNKSAVDVEEIVKLFKELFPNSSTARSIKLGRTKASAVTGNVIGRSHTDELVEIMKRNPFSLMIDESTDVSNIKTLVMVIRTYGWDGDKLKVRDFFYHAFELVEANAVIIYNGIVDKFLQDGVPYKDNLIGFGADGANVNHGSNHSVAVLLKADCKHLFTIKCVCHSFALCASYACKNIPSQVEWVCREVHSFLNNSPLRDAKFKQLQSIMELKPLRMLHPSATRWLSLEEVVKRMLDRLEVLKVFFNYTDADADSRVKQKMAEIEAVLKDPVTELYLQFLDYILPKVNRLNRMFQAESPQIFRLSTEANQLFRDLLSNFMKVDYLQACQAKLDGIRFEEQNLTPIDQMYMGIQVQDAINNSKLQPEEIDAFRNCVRNFYITLATQVKSRLNLNDPVLESLQIIDPIKVKARSHQSIYPLVKQFPNIVPAADAQNADDEFREILNSTEVGDQNGDDGVDFWGKVLSLKRCDGSAAFPILRKLIPALLSLPHSSAAVERVFSVWNYNKTKVRNRLTTETMCGILNAKEYVKTHKREGEVTAIITTEAKTKFTSKMYKMT